jgi:hypothetical protein
MIKGEIPELDRAGLRKFGLTTGAIVALLFGFLLPWLFNLSHALWPWILAAILVFWALVLPTSLAPVYKGWMKVGMVLGFINTHIILFLLYYLVFFPVGLVIRIAGRDPMARTLTSAPGDSYRVASKQRDHKHFERPY